MLSEEEIIGIPKLLTAKDVGKILGISAKAVNKLAREGRLGHVKITARERRFTKELVEEFVRAETVCRDTRRDEDCAPMNPYHQIPQNPLGPYPDASLPEFPWIPGPQGPWVK
jgi:excisionase family DNA binding protein